jgi:alkylated DNA repair protein (DNA oxidative demethylase)
LARDPALDPRPLARDDRHGLRTRGLSDQCLCVDGEARAAPDQDEEAKDAPILSISLGDTALFRLGGPERKSPTRSLRLGSGDCRDLEGPSRHWFHGVDRILPGTSQLLLPEGGRINLTLRRVTLP